MIPAALLLVAGLLAQGGADPVEVHQVGRVTLVTRPAQRGIGLSLADAADRPAEWPGLGRRDPGPLRLIVVSGAEAFTASLPGQAPSWGAGLALPGARTLVVRVDGVGDPFQTLRHELAHLALHEAVRGRLPLWFDEGYAVLAAGELGRLRVLELNLALAGGRVPTFRELDRELRAGPVAASHAYALAGTALAFMARSHPSGTLGPLLNRLERGEPFADAVAAATGRSLDQLEEAWRRDTKRRYGLVVWLVAGGGWLVLGVVLVAGIALRRRRDRPRRAALDIGWDLPDPGPADPGAELDRPGESR